MLFIRHILDIRKNSDSKQGVFKYKIEMMRTKVILQARLNSSRLPGKMLLPICNLPLVVLCAKRASNSGFELLVATSNQKSDDPLVKILKDHNIEYMRGDLDNVLDRFVKATEDMDDGDLVVRLTGDNPLVDGDFINEIVKFHVKHDHNYTRTLSPQDGFPYGVSAEVISVSALRSIANSNISEWHKEHVTIELTEKGNYALYTNKGDDLSYLKVSIDTFDDYLRVNQIFEGCAEDIELVPWRQLIKILEKFPETTERAVSYKVRGYKSHSRLALGTAQLGMEYGIANKTGKPSLDLSKEIINKALEYGVNIYDTAAAYNKSEEVLGKCIPESNKQNLLLITKLDVFDFVEENVFNDEIVVRLIEQSIYRSLYRLGVKKLPILLLHRWSHFKFQNGIIWQTLLNMRDNGIIGELGVSIQNPDEGLEALCIQDITFIQMPYNILDTRWHLSGFVNSCLKRKDLHIQARSVLLQGVVILPPEQWPLERIIAEKVVRTLERLVVQYNRTSILDLCYAYVLSQDWIDSLVVGMETVEQLNENVKIFNKPYLIGPVELQKEFMNIPEDFLNPANWVSELSKKNEK